MKTKIYNYLRKKQDKKIKFLIENRDIRINLGKNGRKSIEKKYSWEEIVKEYIKVYEELVK